MKGCRVYTVDLPKRGLIPVAVEAKVPRGQFLLLNHKAVVEVELVFPLLDGAPFHHAIEATNNCSKTAKSHHVTQNEAITRFMATSKSDLTDINWQMIVIVPR
jgi:hypothetical protein